MDLALKSPRPAEPFFVKAEPPYDTTLDHAPFETLKEYYPCPPAGVSRTLLTQDIEGAQSFAGIKDPLDPMVVFFPRVLLYLLNVNVVLLWNSLFFLLFFPMLQVPSLL